jgi:hypothetical protein
VNSFCCFISWAGDDLSNNVPHQSSLILHTHSHDRVALLTVPFVLCLFLWTFVFQLPRTRQREEDGSSSPSFAFSSYSSSSFPDAVINRSICRIAASNVETAASCLSDQRLGIICSIVCSSGREWDGRQVRQASGRREGVANAPHNGE